MTITIDKSILEAALVGLEGQREAIVARIAEVRHMLNGHSTITPTTPEGPKQKRQMSAAGKARVAAAQRKRWRAAHRKAAEQTKQQEDAKARRIAGLAKARRVLAARRKAGRKKIAHAA